MAKRKRHMTLWAYTPKKSFQFDKHLHKYTMLVAWHKFDRYERHILSQVTRFDIQKLPFITVIEVWLKLHSQADTIPYLKKGEYYYPVKSYMLRIERAAAKEWRKTHRKRERLKV